MGGRRRVDRGELVRPVRGHPVIALGGRGGGDDRGEAGRYRDRRPEHVARVLDGRVQVHGVDDQGPAVGGAQVELRHRGPLEQPQVGQALRGVGVILRGLRGVQAGGLRSVGDRRGGRRGGSLVDHGRLGRAHHVRRQQQARVLGADVDGVAVAVAGDGRERLIEHRGPVQGPRLVRGGPLEGHDRVDRRRLLRAGGGGDRDRHHEPLRVAGQRRHVERRRAVAVLRHRRPRGGQGPVLGVHDGPLPIGDGGEPLRRVALLGGRRAGRDVVAVRGLRLRDGQAVLGAGDRLGRARRRRTPPERDGQRRGPENPQVRKPGPAPSECHAKAEYRVCPAAISARWAGLTDLHVLLA